MTLADLQADLERRAGDAERLGASAPVATVLRQVVAELAAGLDGNGAPARSAGHPPTTLLTAREAAQVLHVAPRWLYRHAGALPFTRRLGPKTVRFDPDGLARWVARR